MSDITKRNILKCFIYVIITFILFSIQTTPNLISIFNISPNLILSFSFFICIFENDEFFASVYGAFIGLMLDTASNYVIGFNGIILMITFPCIIFLYKRFLKTKFINSLFCFFIVDLLIEFMNFIFFYLIWYELNYFVFLNTLFLIFYTLLICPFTYISGKKIYHKFNY